MTLLSRFHQKERERETDFLRSFVCYTTVLSLTTLTTYHEQEEIRVGWLAAWKDLRLQRLPQWEID